LGDDAGFDCIIVITNLKHLEKPVKTTGAAAITPAIIAIISHGGGAGDDGVGAGDESLGRAVIGGRDNSLMRAVVGGRDSSI
jgi:hypothetical protein